MEQDKITKNQILTVLSKSPHGELAEYVPAGKAAARYEPEFLAHLIAWDRLKGQVRDSKAALPIVSLSEPHFPDGLVENSLAHLALLSPRELLKAYRFAFSVRLPGRMRTVKRLLGRYLKYKEQNGFDRVALTHKAVLKELYALGHVKPGEHADRVLFKGIKPHGSVFEAVSLLATMSPTEAAGTILEKKIPFLVALGALGKKAKETDLVMALIERMTPTELTTNAKMLEKLGVKDVPALRAAYAEAIKRASTSKKTILKTSKAAEAVEDESTKKQLQALQEKQLSNLQSIDGNWVLLVDKSGSMEGAIDLGREIAALLARMVKGTVSLVFFNTSAKLVDVTGKTLDEIKELTQYERASGCTSIGCALEAAIAKGVEIDGIALVTDGGENATPYFTDVYKALVQVTGKVVPIYLHHIGDKSLFAPFIYAAQRAGVNISSFELGEKVDYYSLPNLVATMRTNKYSLVDEVFAVPLVTLEEVFK